MKVLVILTILLVSPFSVIGQSKTRASASPQTTEQELRALILLWDEAEKRNDAAAIDKLLAPEFSFLGGSTRQEYLKTVVPDPTFKYSSTIEDLKIEIFGDSALVTARESAKGTMGNKVAEGTILILTVWLRRSARWQCIRSSIQNLTMEVKSVPAPGP